MALTAIAILFLTAVTPLESAAQSNGPVVRISLNYLPPYVFTAGSPTVQVSAVEPFPARITWTVEPGSSGEPVEAVRYGWNVLPQGDDAGWDQSWCATCLVAPLRIFRSGTWRFLLEARDHAGVTTLAQLEIIVAPVAIESATWGDFKSRFAH